MNPIFQTLHDEVSALKTVVDSAVALMNGTNARIAAAVATALAGGATAQELADAVNAEIASIDSAKADLAAAVAANTPPAP